MIDTEEISLDDLKWRLAELRRDLEVDPLANPVRRLSHELSKAIEAGRLSLDDTGAMIAELSAEAAGERRDRGRSYLASGRTLDEAAAMMVDGADDMASFEERTRSPVETVVFTGHPTFAMAPGGGAALRSDGSPTAATKIRRSISLDDEHAEACDALMAAAGSAVRASAALLRLAHERFGEEFRSLLPVPVGLATWVGYDLDGRQDIGWTRIFRHRLIEKTKALEDYVDRLVPYAADPGIAEALAVLRAAAERTARDRDFFCDDRSLASPEGIAAAANQLTSEHRGRLTSLAKVIATIRSAAQAAPADQAIELLAIASLMQTRGLGLGHIHFRLNASQVRNAARSLLKLDRDADLFGHSVLATVSDAVDAAKPLRVNFATLAEETSSARRIAIAAAQVLKHVDEDTPIRLLIAECENPVTVLTAGLLARRYGISEKLDICPLFETAQSFERSGRILSVLLGQPAFREQARRRGRVAIEAGFSDAGRFMGQLPATMAIERLQGQLAREMERQGLQDLEAVVFNTHGESMGRGGHPSSVVDRSLYVMSPWARAQFARAGIRLGHEISFQGGDGFSWFASREAADAVIAGLLTAARSEEPDDDPFYSRTEASLDFYNTVRAEQMDLFCEEAMATVVMGPGLSLLPLAGSRKTKRQFERSGEEEISLRRIRAISNNGSLQQLGYVANVHGGVGEAIGTETEAYTELTRKSDRFARMMRLVARAAELSDMKTLIAYMKLYDGSFWATRPISGSEPGLERPCGDLAAHLVGDRRYFAALELAARLRPGAIKLKRGLALMGFEQLGPAPLNLDLLHALRLALMQHMFLLGARLPAFARAAGFSRPEVLDRILALDVPSAVESLRHGFPHSGQPDIHRMVDEPADEDDVETDYGLIERETIAPLELAFEQCQRISLAVAHHFGAHG